MDELLLERRNSAVSTITLNRPEKHNALTPEMMLELIEALGRLAGENEVRAVIIRGAGNAFSAGFDISRIGSAPSHGGEVYANAIHRAMAAIEEFPCPVIAMIHGWAVGGGLELAVGCDLRIVADTARLGMTPTRLGVVYGVEPLRRFLDIIGAGYTKELFLIGGLIDAHRAWEIGLVHQVVPVEKLEEVTYQLAQEIAENAPLPLQGIKLAVNKLTRFRRLSQEDEKLLEEMLALSLESEDLREGRRAFQERRKPRFIGR